MDKIIVIDDFLKKDDLDKAQSIITNNKWAFGHKSKGTESYEIPFWHMKLDDEEFFSKYIKNIIEQEFLKKFELIRVYANGQTFGQDGSYHEDTPIEDGRGDCFTFCLYLCPIPKETIEIAGGYVYFKIPGEKYKICYEPVFNRGLFFPATITHKSSSFCRYIMNIRICVSWKLREIKE